MALPLLSPSSGARIVPLLRTRESVLDEELVERTLRGEVWAPRELYDRHAAPLLGRAVRLLGRTSEAEDVVQEAFLEAFRDLKKLEDRGRFGAWLRGIALHRVHRRFRRRRLLARLGLDRGEDDARLEQLAHDASPELRLELAEIDRALQKLPADLRVAWGLRFVEGCELQEIAELTFCSLATVKRRLAKAREVMGHGKGEAR